MFPQPFGNSVTPPKTATLKEQRRSPRFPVGAQVVLVLENGVRVLGKIWDMSTTGVFVVTPERPYGLFPGEPGLLFLHHDQAADEATENRFPCEIIRVDADGLAVEFHFNEH